jgi:hypothetical protein
MEILFTASGQIEPRLHGRGSAEAQIVKKLSDIRERLPIQAKWEAVENSILNARPRIRSCRHTSSKSPNLNVRTGWGGGGQVENVDYGDHSTEYGTS